MLILGIDTSTSVCSLALYDGEKVLAEWSVDNGFTHSQKMMPQLESMLKNSGIEKTSLAGISVSIGPGSFTGLRIGLSSAKTMAYALNIPICGISTLAALAFNLPLPGVWLSPLIDGQKGNVYQAVYEWHDTHMTCVQQIQFVSLAEAINFLGQSGRKCFLLGEYPQVSTENLPQNVFKAAAHVLKPRAASVAILGYERLLKSDFDDAFSIEPYYMKKSEAEILWEKKNKIL